jgi:hypothetical protein
MAIEAVPEAGGVEQHAEKLDSLKGTGFREGTGFSPYMNNDATSAGALAPEAGSSTTASASSAASDANPAEAAPVAPAKLPRGLLEARMEAVLAELSAPTRSPSATLRQGHLALVKRWYYRPEARREGEIFFPDAEGRWPVKAMLRGVGRVFASAFKPPAS